jgi:hypothetical protein
LFNTVIRHDVARLAGRGVTPAALLDPKVHATLPPDVYRDVGRTISGGLLWVFAGMLACAVLQVLVTLLLPARKCDHAVGRTEGLEAMAG